MVVHGKFPRGMGQIMKPSFKSYQLPLSEPAGELRIFRLPYLVFMKPFELFISWWLEARDLRAS